MESSEEGDYRGSQEGGRPQGQGRMDYRDTDALDRSLLNCTAPHCTIVYCNDTTLHYIVLLLHHPALHFTIIAPPCTTFYFNCTTLHYIVL